MKNSFSKILFFSNLLLLQTSGFASNVITDRSVITGSYEISESQSLDVNGVLDIKPDPEADVYKDIKDGYYWWEYYLGYLGYDPVRLINKGTVNFKSGTIDPVLSAGELKIQDAGIVVNENTMVFEKDAKLTAVMNSDTDTIKFPTLYNGNGGVINVQAEAEFDGGNKDKFIFDNAGTVKFAGKSIVKNINIHNSGIVDISSIDAKNTTVSTVSVDGGTVKFADNLLKSATEDLNNLPNLSSFCTKDVTLTAGNNNDPVISVAKNNSNKYELSNDQYYKYLSIYKIFGDYTYSDGSDVSLLLNEGSAGKISTITSGTNRNKEIAYLFSNLKSQKGIVLDNNKFTNPILFANEFKWNHTNIILALFEVPNATINFSNLSESFDTKNAPDDWMPQLPLNIKAKLIADENTVISIANPEKKSTVEIDADLSEFNGTIAIPVNVYTINLKSNPVILDMADGNDNPVSLNIGDSTKAGDFGDLKVKPSLKINSITIIQPVTFVAIPDLDNNITINVMGSIVANKKIKIAANTKLVF